MLVWYGSGFLPDKLFLFKYLRFVSVFATGCAGAAPGGFRFRCSLPFKSNTDDFDAESYDLSGGKKKLAGSYPALKIILSILMALLYSIVLVPFTLFLLIIYSKILTSTLNWFAYGFPLS